MGQRSRKRGRRDRPAGQAVAATTKRASAPDGPATAKQASAPNGPAVAAPAKRASAPDRPVSRSEQRNAEVRAKLEPLAPGERPWAVTVSAALAMAAGAGNLIAYAAGAKIGGKHPAASGILAFSLVMIVCAVGLWRLKYWALLGFMALLAIIATLFALLLTEASNALGFIVAPVIIAGAGFLFWKLVRVLSRVQMPRYPGR